MWSRGAVMVICGAATLACGGASADLCEPDGRDPATEFKVKGLSWPGDVTCAAGYDIVMQDSSGEDSAGQVESLAGQLIANGFAPSDTYACNQMTTAWRELRDPDGILWCVEAFSPGGYTTLTVRNP